MSPSARRHRSCTKKICHRSRREAWGHAKRIGNGCMPYPCSFCGGFHVGHPTSDPVLRSKRRRPKNRRFTGKKGRFQRAA